MYKFNPLKGYRQGEDIIYTLQLDYHADGTSTPTTFRTVTICFISVCVGRWLRIKFLLFISMRTNMRNRNLHVLMSISTLPE